MGRKFHTKEQISSTSVLLHGAEMVGDKTEQNYQPWYEASYPGAETCCAKLTSVA
jgi:hypothetical protein